MREGDLGYKVEIKSNDEIGDLANAFNTMSKDLEISRVDLEEYSKMSPQINDQYPRRGILRNNKEMFLGE